MFRRSKSSENNRAPSATSKGKRRGSTSSKGEGSGKTIQAVPLTEEGYRKFGDVIEVKDKKRAIPANQGTASRFNHVAEFKNFRPAMAETNVTIFDVAPALGKEGGKFTLRYLEHHPYSTQSFIPMNASRYLVLVAEGDREAPNLDTVHAFIASGTQAITYRPGVWHAPMVGLDSQIVFAMFVNESSTEGDCTVITLPSTRTIIVPPAAPEGKVTP